MMTMGKRQVILAALVVALGAAVYLNWQFAGGNEIQTTGVTASEKELGQAQLVNADQNASSAVSGDTASSAETQTATGDAFSEMRLNRQKARDQAVELLEKVLSDNGTGDEAKKEAVQQAAVIAQNTLKESNAENLIKAKGFHDCVVYLENDTCNVVVTVGDKEMAEGSLIIKDIIAGQTSVTYDKIKIIESK